MAAEAAEAFRQQQPSYLRAMFQPSSLRGYQPKNKGIPAWLDYALYGPPVIRDSSPGVMAYIFGRTEHDKLWNPTKKGPHVRGVNILCLIAMYIFFLYVPYHAIYMLGVKPFHSPESVGGQLHDSTESLCKPALFPLKCQPGCERVNLFGCKTSGSP